MKWASTFDLRAAMKKISFTPSLVCKVVDGVRGSYFLA